jgi:hypothetical protein
MNYFIYVKRFAPQISVFSGAGLTLLLIFIILTEDGEERAANAKRTYQADFRRMEDACRPLAYRLRHGRLAIRHRLCRFPQGAHAQSLAFEPDKPADTLHGR